MYFKLGIVGHPKKTEMIKKILTSTYKKDIEFTLIEQSDSTDNEKIMKEIKRQEHCLNSILFTGLVPYKIMIRKTTPQIPWSYLKTNPSQLLRSLLKMEIDKVGDIGNVSIDSYDRKSIEEIYGSIGFEKLPEDVAISSLDELHKDFLPNLNDFHLKNYRERGSYCITNISDTYDYLRTNKVPCSLLSPVSDSILQEFEELLLKHQLRNEQNSTYVVFQLNIDYLTEPTIGMASQYNLLSEKAKLVDSLYLFVQKLSGVLLESNSGGYVIFTNKRFFEKEAYGNKLLNHLFQFSRCVSTSISVGIGYGNTPHIAYYNSSYASDRAQRTGGNRAFIMHDESNIIGPLIPKEMDFSESEVFDELIAEIVNATDLSSKTVLKLISIKKNSNKDYFTPKELAIEFGVTHRTMNRIIERLEMSGHIQVAGKKMLSTSGRPSRILKLNF